MLCGLSDNLSNAIRSTRDDWRHGTLYYSKIFFRVRIGNECKNPKPFPDPYIHALELLNMSNTKAIVFEDSASGILSARGMLPKCIVGTHTAVAKK